MDECLKWKVVVIAGVTTGIALGGFAPAVHAGRSAPTVVGTVSAYDAPGKKFQTWSGGPHLAGKQCLDLFPPENSEISSSISSFIGDVSPPCLPPWVVGPFQLPQLLQSEEALPETK